MTHFAWTYAFGRKQSGLWRCRKGATVAEYGMIACLAVTAWGAVDSPRFQTVKDPAAQRAACVVPVRGHSPRWDRGALERASRICKTRPVSRA